MRFLPDRLTLSPFIPQAYDGERTLRNFRYRGATLTITVRGFGNAISSVTLDGRAIPRAEVPASLTGAHTLEVTMNGAHAPASINVVENRAAPEAPQAALRGNRLIWRAVPKAASYVVHRNGRRHGVTSQLFMRVEPSVALAEYQVKALDAEGFESYLSEPVRSVVQDSVIIAVPLDVSFDTTHAGAGDDGYVSLSASSNTELRFAIEVPVAGRYAIDARYANGSGPINSGSTAAVRSLMVDGERRGALVMPHRGTDLWTDWGYTNPLLVDLSAGSHTLALVYGPYDRNMDGAVSDALLDHVRVTRLAVP
jgi:hypothetical protein